MVQCGVPHTAPVGGYHVRAGDMIECAIAFSIEIDQSLLMMSGRDERTIEADKSGEAHLDSTESIPSSLSSHRHCCTKLMLYTLSVASVRKITLAAHAH